MRFSRWIFGAAGVYGLAVITPLSFLEDRVGQDNPPAITHPEYFYGFIGLGVAWQIAFLCIASDPVRFRLMMLPSMVEKFGFAIAVAVLVARNRVPAAIVGFASVDLVLGILFVIAYLKTAGVVTGGDRTGGEIFARVGLQSLVRLSSLSAIDAEIERLQVEKENAIAKTDFKGAAWLRDRADELKKIKQSWPQNG